jgi:hypothetical protein
MFLESQNSKVKSQKHQAIPILNFEFLLLNYAETGNYLNHLALQKTKFVH